MNEEMQEVAREELVYQMSRAVWLDGWWAYAIALAVVGLLLYGIIRLYRRDTVELPSATRWSLILLRVGVIVGLVVFLLGIERRARQRVTRPSEVAILVDTSQSMSLPQSDLPGGPTRIAAARELVSESPMITELAKKHRVTLYTFNGAGELNEVVVSNSNENQETTAASPASEESASRQPIRSSIAVVAVVILITSAVCMLLSTVLQLVGAPRGATPVLFASVVMLLVGGSGLASQWTVQSHLSLQELLGFAAPVDSVDEPANANEDEPDEEPTTGERLQRIDWESVLVASERESRIGDALRSTLGRHDPSTLAGVFLLTDGQNNSGTPPVSVASLVGRGGTAIYPIGLGSAKPPVNVRIVDVDVPRRVYPGDRFGLNAVLQGSGNEDQKVQVQLIDGADTDSVTNNQGPAEAGANQPFEGELIDTKEVLVPSDGSLAGVQFELEPASVGKRRLAVRVIPPPGDQNELDNERQARYEVVSRRLKALLVAGGPMREYRFVRNLFFRDDSIEVDVWLQTGQEGMSQDADSILTEFPSTAEALFEYDAIMTFDPDWMRFDANQMQLLDQWLSQQAGGLTLISGPVYMPEWMRQRTDPRIDAVRDFYPVRLPTRSALLTGGRSGGETAWPLKLSAEASRAEFLRVDEDSAVSETAWTEFSGVFDFVGVHEAKPGAKVYAEFSDPSAAMDEQLPIYLASQFYGAGRVFFQGSGEMWRLRGVSDAYFDAYYTKLLRWISEGRLLRDSNRGILLVDRPRAMVGDTITVRAILTDEQFQPLRVAQVEAKLLTPSGRVETIRMTPLQGEPREGTYSGRFLIREPGEYELRVTLGNALQEEVLRQPVQASLPTLELERPRRNDEVLRAMAATTGGEFLPLEEQGGSSTDSSSGASPMQLVSQIEPQPQLTILPGTPDREFQERQHASLMWLLCSLLTMEWVVRRLNRLA